MTEAHSTNTVTDFTTPHNSTSRETSQKRNKIKTFSSPELLAIPHCQSKPVENAKGPHASSPPEQYHRSGSIMLHSLLQTRGRGTLKHLKIQKTVIKMLHYQSHSLNGEGKSE